ncbi:hypothetical protein PsorP6_003518 [Peronosclerospora sorghi]|uniref:Uncharacterized protein n=1 Tax=Peronosclerospora sorghi TaxID=230839 RepID=A0ACC0VQF0_9STRA|nr:hypothetical protein PsorP6_003518 [Peronosclerospora sorghi]
MDIDEVSPITEFHALLHHGETRMPPSVLPCTSLARLNVVFCLVILDESIPNVALTSPPT